MWCRTSVDTLSALITHAASRLESHQFLIFPTRRNYLSLYHHIWSSRSQRSFSCSFFAKLRRPSLPYSKEDVPDDSRVRTPSGTNGWYCSCSGLDQEQRRANILNVGPHWVLKCDIGTGAAADGWRDLLTHLTEEKYFMGHEENMRQCQLKMNQSQVTSKILSYGDKNLMKWRYFIVYGVII